MADRCSSRWYWCSKVHHSHHIVVLDSLATPAYSPSSPSDSVPHTNSEPSHLHPHFSSSTLACWHANRACLSECCDILLTCFYNCFCWFLTIFGNSLCDFLDYWGFWTYWGFCLSWGFIIQRSGCQGPNWRLCHLEIDSLAPLFCVLKFLYFLSWWNLILSHQLTIWTNLIWHHHEFLKE